MRVLVTFAVEAEFAPWRRLRKLELIQMDGFELHRARIGRAQVDFLVTGIGIERAQRAAAKALESPYQFCIASGFAGSLRDTHPVGAILVACAVQLLGKSKTLACSRNLVYAARDDGATQVQLFLTADHVVTSAAEKAQLAPFADAVEMEAFGVLAAAHDRGHCAVAIRVISDSAREDMPAIVNTAVDSEGRVSFGGVARYVARHPLQLPALLRLGRNSKTAADALNHFLEAFIKKISFCEHGWPSTEVREVAAR
jgi:adenosylhomocysteine nucleosidase